MHPASRNPVSRIQQPLPSGFGRDTTAAQVIAGIDLRGRNAVVTGGHAGLGLEVVRVLAGAGARIIAGARDPDAARRVFEGMAGVSVERLDLSDRASVDAFAARCQAGGEPLHLLINNAGIMATPLARDALGHEMQLSTNYLGHFRLTARLWPALARARGARVVMLSSGAHRFRGVDLEDPDFERRAYDKWEAYGQSKTAAALFALELDRRGAREAVQAFSVHPGAIQTGLGSHLDAEDLRHIGATDADGNLNPAFAALFKTVEQGAATTVWCATSPLLAGLGGLYCEDCDVAAAIPSDSTSLHGVLPWAIDQAVASTWWEVSERLAGVRFDVGSGSRDPAGC